MPGRRKNPFNISLDRLAELKKQGAQSAVLDARLEFVGADKYRGTLEKLLGLEVCYPDMKPTQAGGRWSTTDPPAPGFPTDARAKESNLPPLRHCFRPHRGFYWLAWDFDAIEAKIVALLSGDEADIEAFNRGWDIHTLTACGMFRLERPPDLTNALHKAESCAEWRRAVRWEGKDDLRRNLAKTGRYACNYGPDEYAMLNARGIEKLGLSHKELLAAGRAYLASKPKLVAWKQATWNRCKQDRMARTFLGLRRMLFGKPDEMAREGLSHEVSGSVSGIMNLTLATLVGESPWGEPTGLLNRLDPRVHLAMNAHDGVKLELPEDVPVRQAFELAKPVVEKEWEVGPHKIVFTASYEIVRSDGSHEAL